jgi:hypothetical protein
MNFTVKTCGLMLRRVLNIVGVTAAGSGLVSLQSSGQVFAHQFLRDATPVEIPAMVYSPELQIMVEPGTGDPVFTQLPRGRANGEYQVAPLVSCPGSPGCPAPKRQPTSRVTPGGGPNGPGPTADSD